MISVTSGRPRPIVLRPRAILSSVVPCLDVEVVLGLAVAVLLILSAGVFGRIGSRLAVVGLAVSGLAVSVEEFSSTIELDREETFSDILKLTPESTLRGSLAPLESESALCDSAPVLLELLLEAFESLSFRGAT